MSLSLRLSLIFGIVILAATALPSALVGRLGAERLRAEIERGLAATAEQMRDKLDRGMFERTLDIRVASSLTETFAETGSPDAQREALARLQAGYPVYAWIGFVAPSGRVLVATGGLLEGEDVSGRDWFAPSTRGPFVGDVHEARLLQRFLAPAAAEPLRFVDVAAPVTGSDGRLQGVVAAHLSWTWAEEVSRSVIGAGQVRDGVELAILAADGRVLHGPADFPAARPAVQGGTPRLDLSGLSDRYIVAVSRSEGYRDFGGLGWWVVARQAKSTAFAPIVSLQWAVAAVGLVAAAVFMALAWFSARRIAHPLERLTLAADEVRREPIHARMPEVRGYREVRLLGQSLSAALEALHLKQRELLTLNATLEQRVSERTRALRDANESLDRSRQRAEGLFQTVSDAILVTDGQGRITDSNRSAARLFRMEPEALAGMPVDELLTLADGSASVVDRLFCCEAAVGTIDATGIRSDGERFDASLGGSLTEFGSETVAILSIRDVSGRKEVERLKGEFVATVSHELRTPMTSIAGSLGLLAGGAAGPLPEQARRLVDIARKNSERLVRLINDILDLEKMESGSVRFDLRPVALGPLVEAAVEANRSFAAGFRVELETAVEDEAVAAVDADRLAQVLTNLISNAVKFSPEGGVVTVALRRHRGWARIAVRDRGPGVPEEFRERIFSRFAQADSSDARRQGGTGLGLSIGKQIVERLGGRIGFESRAGWGSEFQVDLPPAPGDRAEEPPSAGARILVYGPPASAEAVETTLRMRGYEVVRPAGPDEARRRLASDDLAAAVLAPGLADGEGPGFLRDLRAGAADRRIPVVLAGETEALAVADWLDVPIDLRRLAETVGEALEGAGGRPLVLHLDDDEDVLQIVAAALGVTAEVVSARSLAEARAALKARRFNLAILDLALPEGSGLELLPLLRDDGDRPIPVVVFSARDEDAATAEAVDAFLTKSGTSLSRLAAAVQRLTGARRGAATDRRRA